jgi:hypothetical protein
MRRNDADGLSPTRPSAVAFRILSEHALPQTIAVPSHSMRQRADPKSHDRMKFAVEYLVRFPAIRSNDFVPKSNGGLGAPICEGDIRIMAASRSGIRDVAAKRRNLC